MVLKLTRSEIAREINVSVQAVTNIAIKRGFKESFKLVNNREVTAYEINEVELKKLKNDYLSNGDSSTLNSFESDLNEDVKHTETLVNKDEIIDKILEFSNLHNQRIETYIERACNAEQQVKLITTSETNKDNEINRLNAYIKELESKVKTLESKWWNKKVF